MAWRYVVLVAFVPFSDGYSEWDIVEPLLNSEQPGQEIPTGSCGINGMYNPKTELYEAPKNIRELKCNKRMTTNCSVSYNGLKCPASCGFLVPNTAFSCLLECVPANECSARNPNRAFPNPKTGICESCPITGCKVCTSKEVCGECHNGFSLDRGHCRFTLDQKAHWPIVLLVLACVVGLLVLLAIAWFICHGPHPNWEANMVSIMRARRHRRLCKVYSWDLSDFRSVRNRYGLAENMHKRNVLGVGVALFYNNILFVGMLAALFLVVTFVLFETHDVSKALGKFEDKNHYLLKHRFTPQKFQPAIIMSPLAMCQHTSGQETQEALKHFAKKNFIACGILYVVSFVASICFGFLQRRADVLFDEHNATMSDYALKIEGLPPDVTSEPEIKEWLEQEFRRVCPGTTARPPEVVRKQPPLKDETRTRDPSEIEVFGVSIAYNYTDKMDEVNDIMWKEMELMEVAMHKQAGYDTWSLNEKNCTAGDLSDGQLQEKNRKVVNGWFEGDNKLKGSGDVYCVFKYLPDQEKVAQYAEDNPNFLKHPSAPSKPLIIKPCFSEPNCIAWWFVGMDRGALVKRTIKNFLWLMLVILLVQVLVVWPYAKFILLPYAMTGSAAGGMKTTIAGIVLGNVNGILFITNFMTATRVGYATKDWMDAFVLFTNTILVLINTFFNIVITVVMVMNQGGVGLSLVEDVLDGTTLKAVGTENAIARNLYNMLMPGSFFMGLIMSMIMAGWVPFIWNTFLMKMLYIWKCFPECILKILKAFLPWAPPGLDIYPFRSAEKAFEPWEVPVCGNYADQIVTPTICFCFLFFCSPYTHKVFLGMLLWCIFEYFYFRYMHLRYHKMCTYTTSRLDSFSNFMWGLPLSVIAAACCHWGFRSAILASPSTSTLTKATMICCIFWVSNLLWLVAYRFLVNPFKMKRVQDERQHKTVEELSAETVYSWFNCNPPFVLKCKYFFKDAMGKSLPARLGNHPIACGQDPEQVRFFEVGKQGLFAKPERQKLVFRLHDDWMEYETWFELVLAIMDFFARTGRCGYESRKSRAVSSFSTEAEMSLLGENNNNSQ